MEYGEAVLEHFRAPRNAGSFPPGTPGVSEAATGTRRHGREIRLSLKLGNDGRIEACRYRVYGCPATVALCSVLSERLRGLSLDEAGKLSGMALAEELRLPVPKRDAALLLEDALRAALGGYNMAEKRERA
ncbi:MAG TPA: iron-sulfur cluster assembly scaffold protein [Gammaproteobacteria bacterium]|jgi:nitrogen fixation NifU-like protein|nr:iron-sulfur cluster assembly scaffold protein [Gammaproteobacteria bacterium]